MRSLPNIFDVVLFIVDEAVNTVEQTDDGTICTMTSSGRIFKSRRLIVCIPPTQQAMIVWAPALPSIKVNQTYLLLCMNVLRTIEQKLILTFTGSECPFTVYKHC